MQKIQIIRLAPVNQAAKERADAALKNRIATEKAVVLETTICKEIRAQIHLRSYSKKEKSLQKR